MDLAVIGGGITGAGVAWDAALRGLRCVLFEKGDFGAGTSAATTRLVHGGLRYLEQGDLPLVRESLVEREFVQRAAPHLVRPISILLPTYRGERRRLWQIRIGLAIYRFLSRDRGYRVLGPGETLVRCPGLRAPGLRGAGLFTEYQMPFPERLVLEVVRAAEAAGARAHAYHEVEAVRWEEGLFVLAVRDLLRGSTSEWSTRAVVNAGGPWADEVARRFRPDLPPRVRRTKGVHLVLADAPDHGLLKASVRDQRLFFALPLSGLTLVGTTDTDWDGPTDAAVPEPADAEYLLASLADALPGRAAEGRRVLWAYAGLRPLALSRPGAHPSAVSRRHRIHADGPGGRFVTIVGGKYTIFRRMAEDAVDRVCRSLGARARCRTRRAPLFPEAGPGDTPVPDHLRRLYGPRAGEVAALAATPSDLEPLGPGCADTPAQVRYAVRREAARHLDDLLLRRLATSAAPDLGRGVSRRVAEIAGSELGWSAGRIAEELERYEEILRTRRLCG